MIDEDVEFTRKIIEVFAKNPKFPSGIDEASLAKSLDIQRAGPDGQKLRFHLKCAIDSGLIMGRCDRISTFEGSTYRIRGMDGLTPIGRYYYNKIDTPEKWKKAKDLCLEKGLHLATNLLIELVKNI